MDRLPRIIFRVLMAFTTDDRNMLIQTNTLVKEYGKDIAKNEIAIGVLHGRINKIRNLFTAITAGFGGIVAYFKAGG